MYVRIFAEAWPDFEFVQGVLALLSNRLLDNCHNGRTGSE